jgi:hypothetical protein
MNGILEISKYLRCASVDNKNPPKYRLITIFVVLEVVLIFQFFLINMIGFIFIISFSSFFIF